MSSANSWDYIVHKATLTEPADEEFAKEAKYQSGRRCLILENENNDYESIMFLSYDDDGDICEIEVINESRYRFVVDEASVHRDDGSEGDVAEKSGKKPSIGITEMKREKHIGYMAEKYWDINPYGRHVKGSDWKDIPGMKELIKDFTRVAAHYEAPNYPIKMAALYFTYDDDVYVIDPRDIKCSQEVFECLRRYMEDKLYDFGAYDMFYSGMMD